MDGNMQIENPSINKQRPIGLLWSIGSIGSILTIIRKETIIDVGIDHCKDPLNEFRVKVRN